MTMHADEFPISNDLVAAMLAEQFPQWSGRALHRVTSAGTDNAMVRIGDELVARLPRIAGAVPGIQKEQRLLPLLANHLPIPIPAVVALGQPGDFFPWPWTVLTWMVGESLDRNPVVDEAALAIDLAEVLRSLHAVKPLPGLRLREGRGQPLRDRDEQTRDTIRSLPHDLDVDRALSIWDAALAAPFDALPRVVHGDAMPGNLLIQNGRLAGMIDFGSLALGDRAVDLMPAWNLFSPPARQVFRDATHATDQMWAKGRGWALSQAVIALPYYRETNPVLAGIAQQTIAAVLADSA